MPKLIKIEMLVQLMDSFYKLIMLQQSRLELESASNELESASNDNSSFSSLMFVDNNDGS